MTHFSYSAEPDKPAARRGHWAVLVGVDNYIQAAKLKYCGADQRSFRDRLVAGGFPPEQVFLLHDKANDPKYLPFKANIEKQLELVLNLVEEDDVVVIALSGHGAHLNGKSYFCPTDADLDKPTSLVSLDAVYKQFETSAAALKVLLVDACRNDPRLPGQRSTSTMTPREEARAFTRSLERPPQGVVLLNSCTAGEVSYEDAEFGHGVFMNYVLEGLGGAADADGNRRVSLDELSRYTNAKTKSFVARKFNDVQRPFLKGDLTVDVLDFELARSSATNPLPPVVVPIAGEKSITNSIGMKFVLIPAGEFEMGSEEDALGVLQRFEHSRPEDIADEFPQHRVRLTKPFYLGVHEVTLGQFLKFYNASGYRLDCERDGRGGWGYRDKAFEQLPRFVPWSWGFSGQTMDHPVCNVSWNDAVAFCLWLSKKEGVVYRLPSEAEWEYACRAGTKTRYSFGNDPEEFTRHGNVGDRSLRTIYRDPERLKIVDLNGRDTGKRGLVTISGNDSYPFTSPVGSFKPNPFGLYDMHGNVAEWCADWYGSEYYATSPAADPRGPAAGSTHVYRGGGWGGTFGRPASCRAAYRGKRPSDSRDHHVGFRVVREATTP